MCVGGGGGDWGELKRTELTQLFVSCWRYRAQASSTILVLGVSSWFIVTRL